MYILNIMNQKIWDIPFILSQKCQRRCNLCSRSYDRKANIICFSCHQIICKDHMHIYCLFCFRKYFDTRLNMNDEKHKQISNQKSNSGLGLRRPCRQCFQIKPKIASKQCTDCQMFLCQSHSHIICTQCILF